MRAVCEMTAGYGKGNSAMHIIYQIFRREADLHHRPDVVFLYEIAAVCMNRVYTRAIFCFSYKSTINHQ